MSLHVNPDGSDSLGFKIEGNGTFVSHDLGISVTAAASLPSAATAKASGAKVAIIQCETTNVRYRLDGVAPTTTTGFLIPFGGTNIILGMEDAVAAKFIAVSGSTTVVNATYSL